MAIFRQQALRCVKANENNACAKRKNTSQSDFGSVYPPCGGKLPCVFPRVRVDKVSAVMRNEGASDAELWQNAHAPAFHEAYGNNHRAQKLAFASAAVTGTQTDLPAKIELEKIGSEVASEKAQTAKGVTALPPVSAQDIIEALPHAVLVVARDGQICAVNAAAEIFFEMSAPSLQRRRLTDIITDRVSLSARLKSVFAEGATVREHGFLLERVRLSNLGANSSAKASAPAGAQWDAFETFPAHSHFLVEERVDLHMSLLDRTKNLALIALTPRALFEELDRRLGARAGARSVSAFAAMLAHEVKNPLSGIRGAAQLLEATVKPQDVGLTKLICRETDRIVSLLARVEMFSDGFAIHRTKVNIHEILDHVKAAAKAGFARHITFMERYDPSLPPVHADPDLLTQLFLNLVKNAAEAIGEERRDGVIELSTAFRPGLRIKRAKPVQGAGLARNSAIPSMDGDAQGFEMESVSLPLEFCVHDNGGGIAPDMMARLFDPFVSSKPHGKGLGLAIVAKIIADHGGLIECESSGACTSFRLRMPVFKEAGKNQGS